MKLQKFSGNPIISPNPNNKWESFVTTNPGAYYDEKSETVYLLYRAADSDVEHKIYFGLATSKDGYNFTRVSEKPVFGPSENGFDAGCVEDPRIIKMGDYFYITYAARPFPPGQYWLQKGNSAYKPENPPAEFPHMLKENTTITGLTITKDFKTFIRCGRITSPIVDDRDVIFFPEKINGKFYMIHRPKEWVGSEYGSDHPCIWITDGVDMMDMNIKSSKKLMMSQEPWEDKLGANTPPIKTEHGWLLLYHGVGKDLYYRLGAALLDLNDPTKVLCRTKDWIMEPDQKYETKGLYNGVVFPCGAVVIKNTLFVYYGGADVYTGVATCNLNDIINELVK